MNCYISLSGIITFKNSVELVNTVSKLPLQNLMVEVQKVEKGTYNQKHVKSYIMLLQVVCLVFQFDADALIFSNLKASVDVFSGIGC